MSNSVKFTAAICSCKRMYSYGTIVAAIWQEWWRITYRSAFDKCPGPDSRPERLGFSHRLATLIQNWSGFPEPPSCCSPDNISKRSATPSFQILTGSFVTTHQISTLYIPRC
jgi:hypothetical protein